MAAAEVIIGLALQAATAGTVNPPRTQALDPLIACRSIKGDSARLACFDREVAALSTAAETKKIVVLDEKAVRETRRSLFGFALPTRNLFGKDNADSSKREDTELKRLDTVVTSSAKNSAGQLVFTVEGGARWVQDDDRMLMLARIKPGTKVRISAGMLGSYFAAFEGNASAKVRRDR
ncbi:hypothetical protein [Sphingomonas sp. Mn802worker]|uniref:hypothetical protein n=1 Tax=Sphingomonas sp. Mn802worker TaxID=629773 RepID=UPI000374F0FD|nr:hypothetical protein [Sphingomonas sp. Mn802worker]